MQQAQALRPLPLSLSSRCSDIEFYFVLFLFTVLAGRPQDVPELEGLDVDVLVPIDKKEVLQQYVV